MVYIIHRNDPNVQSEFLAPPRALCYAEKNSLRLFSVPVIPPPRLEMGSGAIKIRREALILNKKLLCMLLSVSLALGLAACGAKPAPSSSPSAGAASASSDSAASVSAAQSAPDSKSASAGAGASLPAVSVSVPSGAQTVTGTVEAIGMSAMTIRTGDGKEISFSHEGIVNMPSLVEGDRVTVTYVGSLDNADVYAVEKA